MKCVIVGILVLVMLLAGCGPGTVPATDYEAVQQDLLAAEATVSEQQAEIAELSTELDKASEALEIERSRSAELASSLEQTGAELEEAQAILAKTEVALADMQMVKEDISLRLADVQEQIEAISETPFGLYSVMDTPGGKQLWSSADSDEVLINGYILVKGFELTFRCDSLGNVTLGDWLVMAVSALGVEMDKEVLSSLITGPGVDRKYVAVGYEDILGHFSQYSADHYGSKMFAYIPFHLEPGLGWVSDYPIRVLKHPLIEFLNPIHGPAKPLQFELLEKPSQVMTLALDPELIVQARESAAEAGFDFEEWLTEAILAKIGK